MKLRLRHIVCATAPLVIGSVLVLGAAGSASAATNTFTISGGSLTIAPSAGIDLTPQQAGGVIVPGTTNVTGLLGTVAVTDSRGDTAAWNASASSTAFTGTTAGDDSASSAVTYSAGTVDTSLSAGSVTAASDGVVTLPVVAGAAVSEPVVAATLVSGDNVASWDPTLDITMPASSLADTYTSTLTTSVI